MRCGNHFGIFTSGQLQSDPRCWILKSLLSRDVGGLWLVYELRVANRVLTFQISAWVEGNHVVVNLFIILYFVVEFDGIRTSTKEGFTGV